jgi:hypothetical protein
MKTAMLASIRWRGKGGAEKLDSFYRRILKFQSREMLF